MGYHMDQLIGKIYSTTNIINGMQYVGQTIQLSNKKYKGSGNLITEAFKKYGHKNFVVKTLEYVYDRGQLDSKEIKWIAELNTIFPAGYNISSGGGQYEWTAEAKQTLSNAKKGTKCSEETKQKISIALRGRKGHFTGKKHTKETKQKISNNWIGRKHTEETKQKMRKAWIKRKQK